MKCIILANNSSNDYEILKEYKGSSVFKRTVISNMPYCDKYIVLCKSEQADEINRQISELRDVEYTVMTTDTEAFEENMMMALNGQEEDVYFTVPCEAYCYDIINYKEYIIAAKKCALSGEIAGLSYDNRANGIYCFKKSAFYNYINNGKTLEEINKTEIKYEKQKEDSGQEMVSDFCLKLNPAFKDYLWGGVKLREKYGKQCDLDIIAESWELSAHEAGESIIANGSFKDKSFGEYLSETKAAGLGWKYSNAGEFPILIKFIDAKNPLSIQVHPDDDYALMYEDEYGKNEMWYILDCEEGAGIYCGFKCDTSAEEVRERIENNTILDILNWIPVKKGDVYFIKAGTVHAIGGGIMICEIQQSSNCTYRLYDYDRVDKEGNKRELHIEKALNVLDYKKYEQQTFEVSQENSKDYSEKMLSSCKYFQCVSYDIDGKLQLKLKESSFKSIICVNGQGCISKNNDVIDFKMGDSLFLPKGNDTVQIEGNCELVITEL